MISGDLLVEVSITTCTLTKFLSKFIVNAMLSCQFSQNLKRNVITLRIEKLITFTQILAFS